MALIKATNTKIGAIAINTDRILFMEAREGEKPGTNLVTDLLGPQGLYTIEVLNAFPTMVDRWAEAEHTMCPGCRERMLQQAEAEAETPEESSAAA